MEHAIVLLKPSPIIDQLHSLLIEQFLTHGLEIVDTRKIRLSTMQIEQSFATLFKWEDYVDYMSSGEVKVYLLKGDFAISKAKIIKHYVRSLYNITRFDLENLIHSSDEGLEYYLQFKCLFPEYDICNYSGYADVAVLNRNSGDDNYSGAEVDICFGDSNTASDKLLYRGIKKTFSVNGTPIPFIAYTPLSPCLPGDDLGKWIKLVNKKKGIVVISELPVNEYTDSLFTEITSLGISAAFVFDIQFSLEESKNIQDLLEKYAVLPLGGSNGKLKTMEITICEDTYNKAFSWRRSKDEY